MDIVFYGSGFAAYVTWELLFVSWYQEGMVEWSGRDEETGEREGGQGACPAADGVGRNIDG